MITYRQAFEQFYSKALIEYYNGDDYVPLLTEGFTKITPKQVFDEFAEGLISAIYDVLDKEDRVA